MSNFIKKVKNSFKHVGAGRNVNLFTLMRNAIPVYLFKGGYAFKPLTVYLSINSVCNMRCKMCDFGQDNIESSFYKNLSTANKGSKLELARLLELLEEISKYRPMPRVSVTTTEPFLYKDLFKIAKLANSYGMEFQVTTNGSLIKKHIEDIFESRVSELCVSIDARGNLHDEIRGMPGLYNSIKESLDIIYNRKQKSINQYPKISIATTISNFNYASISELVDDLDERLYDRIIMTHMNFVNKEMAQEHNKKLPFVGKAEISGLPGNTNNYEVDVSVLYRQIEYIKSKYKKILFAPDFSQRDLEIFYYEPQKGVWNSRCYIPWFVIEILSNGDVIPLTRCLHNVMGNIYNNSLYEIWNGVKYRTFRKQLINYRKFPVCGRCRGIL